MFSLFWKLIEADYRVTENGFSLNNFLQSKAINILLSDRYHRLLKRVLSAAGALQIHITEEKKHCTGIHPVRHAHTDSSSFLYISLVLHGLNLFEFLVH